MITLQIDGQEVTAEEGQTVLQAACSAGIFVPTLCHHDALSPFGSCRLCVVEVEKEGQKRIEAACSYPAEQGITVFTNTLEVLLVRKTTVTLLLSRCPQVPLIQKLAAALGIEKKDLPLTGNEKEECILCGRCVRVCREAIGKDAVSFAYRGTERRVMSPFGDQSKDCIGCTACAFVCPTGAIKITEQDGNRHLEPWNTDISLVKCSSCERLFVPEKVLAHLEEQSKVKSQKSKVESQKTYKDNKSSETANAFVGAGLRARPLLSRQFSSSDDAGIPESVMELCPVCRRKETAAAFIQLDSIKSDNRTGFIKN